MKKPDNKVISFRVPLDVAAKIDKVADELPRGSVSKVLSEIFIPALNRYVKRRERKTETVAA